MQNIYYIRKGFKIEPFSLVLYLSKCALAEMTMNLPGFTLSGLRGGPPSPISFSTMLIRDSINIIINITDFVVSVLFQVF